MKNTLRTLLVATLLVPTFLLSSCKKDEATTVTDPGFKTYTCVIASDSSADGVSVITSNASNQITAFSSQGISANITYAGDSAYYSFSDSGLVGKEVLYRDGANWKKSVQRISGATDFNGIPATVASTVTITPTYVGGKITTITSVTQTKITALGQTVPVPNTTETTTLTYNTDGNLSKYIVTGDSSGTTTYNITYGTTAISSSNIFLATNVADNAASTIILPFALGYFEPFTKMPASVSNGSGTLTFSNGVVDANKNVTRYNMVGTGGYQDMTTAVKSTFKCK